MLKQQLSPYIKLMRLHKPIGMYLLLWPTLWGLWFAQKGVPSIKNLLIFILGVIVMRSAGCVINDFADRHLDGHVKRTQDRPLVNAQIAASNALILFFLLCAIGFILVLLTNVLTISLAVFALIFASIYPFMKRFTHWPQLFLGVAFAFSIPMGFAAQIDTIPPLAWLLMFTTILWIIAYDTEYAMVDREDDLLIGVKSTAILFGQYDQLIIAGLQMTVIGLMGLIGWWQQLSIGYYLCLFIASILCIYQQRLLRSGNTANYFRAFLNNHWFGAIVFVGVVLGFW